MSNAKATTSPRISAIIVNYNDVGALVNSVGRLLTAQQPALIEVVIVDNASTDGSRTIFEAARKRWPCSRTRVIWLQQQRNLGFGKGVNLGFTQATGDQLLVMNPDVMLEGESLMTLSSSLVNHPDVGMVAPRLLNGDGSLQLSCRRHYTLPVLTLRTFPFNRLWPSNGPVNHHLMAEWDHSHSRDVDWIVGACLLLRREALETRIFDERFFLYFEDVDLAIDLRQRGWRVVYVPDAVARHEHRRKSANLIPSRAKIAHLHSLLKFAAKHPRLLLKPAVPQ